MQVLKDPILCHLWQYTEACVYTGKENAASWAHMLHSDSGKGPFILEIHLFERFALALGLSEECECNLVSLPTH